MSEGYPEVAAAAKSLVLLAKGLGEIIPEVSKEDPGYGVILQACAALAALAGSALRNPVAVPSAVLAAAVASRIFEDETCSGEELAGLVNRMLDPESGGAVLLQMAEQGIQNFSSLRGAAN